MIFNRIVWLAALIFCAICWRWAWLEVDRMRMRDGIDDLNMRSGHLGYFCGQVGALARIDPTQDMPLGDDLRKQCDAFRDYDKGDDK